MIAKWHVGAFTLKAHENRWIPWSEVVASACPGRGRIREDDHRFALREMMWHPGVYLVALTSTGRPPRGLVPHPTHSSTVYVGESGSLLRRMRQFGNSAGFFGKRRSGHSGGWRWRDEWPKAGAFFAFYPAPAEVTQAGLTPLWRLCREAQALAAFARVHRDQLPELNAKGANDSLAD